MELHFHDRDRVGVQDSVLLEDFESIDVFIDNLHKRHRADLIYTSIGHVLISVNPYKSIPIYGEEIIREYRRAGFLETAPHVFAIADTAYRSITEERISQCILISGESGAGKTEASKKILEFIASASGHTNHVETIKDKLLWSNPVLEAFGNAKTIKNDNSSRFGKFMNVMFDWQGNPTEGNIENYLLEKSRVVRQTPGERNFHIFYQLLSGADDELLNDLGLVRDRAAYAYLNHYNNSESANDAEKFREVCCALDSLKKASDNKLFDLTDMLKIVASILHLGNVKFVDVEDVAQIVDDSQIHIIAKLLGCSAEDLSHALTHLTIQPQGDLIVKQLDAESAAYARDALAKAMFDRLFSWLVLQLNISMTPQEELKPEHGQNPGMGILDIYGFEVLEKNSFEQFCINLCNEKLQQLFIQLTLRLEQEEYLAEGIDWIKVDYEDNKEICDMIDERPNGITSMLNEECLLPGKPTDLSFLAKINKKWAHEKYYFSHESSDIQTQKTLGRDEFRLVHYAGEVKYCVNTFIDKNIDLLYRDLSEVMTKTTNSITKSVFLIEEVYNKRRPDTTISKFQRSLNELMIKLKNKQPSYIRCIRPNDIKEPGVFDETSVRHQVKYLGLMENLRIRRAGFAYRKPYEDFLKRYKCLSKKTWPHFNGSAKDGVQALVNDIGYTADDYKMGKTKIFIRSPVTIFKTEDAFQLAKNRLVADIQKIWRGRRQRKEYLKIREAVISIERVVRGFLGRREALRRRQAITTIRKFITGFLTRNGPVTELNEKFMGIARAEWLKRLAKNLPKNLLDKSWPPCPVVCNEASILVQNLYRRFLARKYRMALTPEKKHQFELKILAETLFKNTKKGYEETFPNWFKTDRLNGEDTECVNTLKSQLNGEKIKYCTSAHKYDRHGYKKRSRVLLVTDKFVYVLDPKTGKLKHKLTHQSIMELIVTGGADSLLLVRIPPELRKDKGDLILVVPHLIETVTMFADITKMPQVLKINTSNSVTHHVVKGSDGNIQVLQSPIPKIAKSKSGQLVVEG